MIDECGAILTGADGSLALFAEVGPADANVSVGSGLKLAANLTLPEAPLFVAGGLGGPLVIGVLTPLRNALTLASQDSVVGP